MLESLESKDEKYKGWKIEFKNKILSQNIYGKNIDSVNLIIGNNGSGKTSFIKSIIKNNHDSYFFVYYTLSKFHSSLGIYQNFFDASSALDSLKVDPFELYEVIEHCFETFKKKGVIECGFGLKSSSDISFKDYEKNIKRYSGFAKKVIDGLKNEGGDKNEKIACILAALDVNVFETKLDMRLFAIFESFLLNNKDFFLENGMSYIDIEKEPYSAIYGISVVLDKVVKMSGRKSVNTEDCIKAIEEVRKNLENKLKEYKDFLEKFVEKNKFTLDQGFLIEKFDSIKIFKDDKEFLAQLYRDGCVSFAFDQISAGEAAILHQIASITYAISKQFLKNENIVIFIDEGDVALHIEWQRKYIQEICKMISNYVSQDGKSRSVHLVFATHSPFLAMDVFKENILCLKKEKNGNKYVPAKAKEKLGFGASMRDLMSESFGASSLLGAISEEHITAIYNSLQKENSASKLSKIHKSIKEKIDNDYINQVFKSFE